MENRLFIFIFQPQSSLLKGRWLIFVHYFLVGLSVIDFSSSSSLSCIHTSEGASQNWTQPSEGWVHISRWICFCRYTRDESLISHQHLISVLYWWMYGLGSDELLLQNCSAASYSTPSLCTCLLLPKCTTLCLTLLNCTPSLFRSLFCDDFDLAYSLLSGKVQVNADNSANQRISLKQPSSPVFFFCVWSFHVYSGKVPSASSGSCAVYLHLSW